MEKFLKNELGIEISLMQKVSFGEVNLLGMKVLLSLLDFLFLISVIIKFEVLVRAIYEDKLLLT